MYHLILQFGQIYMYLQMVSVENGGTAQKVIW